MSVAPQSTPNYARRRAFVVGGIIVAVVAALVVVLVVLKPFGSGGEHETDDKGPVPSKDTPEFAFERAGTQLVMGGSKPSSNELAAARKQAGEIAEVMNRVYGLGFLDPEDWKPGEYGDVFEFFEAGQPATRAQRDEETLTLGADAGKSFTKVEPKGGTLRVRLLLTPGGKPDTADARVTFQAVATGKDGTETLVRSDGHYFLQIRDDAWVVIAYDVQRSDHPVKSGGKKS